MDWDDSKYLEAEPGQYITVARKAKGTNNWFVGNVAGYDGYTSRIRFDFLDAGKTYMATIYSDAPGANYKDNPNYVIRKVLVNNKSKLTQLSAPDGGCAISIIDTDGRDVKGIKWLK
ncbi:MAG: glycoside hydrolase family 97 C-terminal domain-containing protein [Parafilimonas sp.]